MVAGALYPDDAFIQSQTLSRHLLPHSSRRRRRPATTAAVVKQIIYMRTRNKVYSSPIQYTYNTIALEYMNVYRIWLNVFISE